MAKIAIVDDSRLARVFAINCLRSLDPEILEIEPVGIFDVMKTLREQVPDVLLMDFLMPNCPGTSLVRTCREDATLKEMRIVVITAHHDEEIQSRLERMGVSAFLHKPFEPSALQGTVRQLLSERD